MDVSHGPYTWHDDIETEIRDAHGTPVAAMRTNDATTFATARLLAASFKLLEACEIAEAEINSACRSKILGSTWTSIQCRLADAIRAAGGDQQ